MVIFHTYLKLPQSTAYLWWNWGWFIVSPSGKQTTTDITMFFRWENSRTFDWTITRLGQRYNWGCKIGWSRGSSLEDLWGYAPSMAFRFVGFVWEKNDRKTPDCCEKTTFLCVSCVLFVWRGQLQTYWHTRLCLPFLAPKRTSSILT